MNESILCYTTSHSVVVKDRRQRLILGGRQPQKINQMLNIFYSGHDNEINILTIQYQIVYNE